VEKNTELLGKYKGRFYSITRKVKPSFQNIRDFAVTIHFTDSSQEEIEIVRIDYSHGYVHMDCLFKSRKPKIEKPDLDAFSAYDFLKNNWKKYAEKHRKNH
jgi:hypothetical protein